MKKKLENLSPNDRQAVEEFCQRVVEGLGHTLVSIKLFGSKVRGDDTPESDIDLAVIVQRRSEKLADHILDIAFDVNLRYSVYISPRVIGQATFQHPVWRFTPFLQNIQRHGVLL